MYFSLMSFKWLKDIIGIGRVALCFSQIGDAKLIIIIELTFLNKSFGNEILLLLIIIKTAHRIACQNFLNLMQPTGLLWTQPFVTTLPSVHVAIDAGRPS